MSSHAASEVAVLIPIVGALFGLPVVVAVLRDVERKTDIVLLWLLLGWAILPWVCALFLACIRPRRELPRHVPAPHRNHPEDLYAEGVYVISTSEDSRTYAIRASRQWRIVYELGGEQRLTARVSDLDLPLGVLAEALVPVS